MTTTTGVPSLTEVETVSLGETFTDMERHQEAFLARHHDDLAYYRQLWTDDPLHNWSRRWEYPFIFEQVRDLTAGGGGRILDAGAGATFFPFYVADQLPGAHIEAVDNDPKMADIYVAADHPQVTFAVDDITGLAYPDAHFDAAYSVSVLEHIPDRIKVASELARVLKPGAPLVLTMDISLDGRRDVPIPQAQALLDALAEHFDPVAPVPEVNDAAHTSGALLTTRVDPKTLPWRWSLRSRVGALVKYHRSPLKMTPPMTVYGSAWRRRA